MDKMLLLLSDGLREIVNNVKEKYNSEIASDLIEADDLIIAANLLIQQSNYRYCNEKNSLIGGIKALQEKINSLITDELRFLSFRFNTFEISFLPKGKEPKYTEDGKWSRENRQSGKPARMIQKLLVKKYSCRDFENFNNWLKSEMMNVGEFKIVEGTDVTKYYHKDYYYKEESTLGNSCMRYTECQPYLEVYNDIAKMLICVKNGQVLGRAIVWEIGGRTLMDRVYVCMDYLENSFFEYAKQAGWWYRETNALLHDGEYQTWFGPYDNYAQPIALDLTIELDKRYEFMPYVDSFRYYNCDLNTINTNPAKGQCLLSNTDGSYGDDCCERYECEHCGRVVYADPDDGPDGMVYSDYEDSWYCSDCAVYCNGIDDYVDCDTETAEVYYTRTDFELFPMSYIKRSDEEITEIDGKYYNLTRCNFVHFNLDTNQYEIEDE